MSKAALGLLLLGLARPLAAQRDPDPAGAALLARAESLARVQSHLDSLMMARSVDRRRGHVVRAGHLVLVFQEEVTPQRGQALTARADSIIEAFSGDLAIWCDSIVGIQFGVSDTGHVLVSAGLERRRPILLDMVLGDRDSTANSQLIAGLLTGRFRERLGGEWPLWLPRDYGVVWIPSISENWAMSALTEPENSTGAGCLAGHLGDCRLWLGLDPTTRPMAVRYRASDLRAELSSVWWFQSSAPDRPACLGGEDAACLRFAESFHLLNPIPSPDIARASLVREVWARHGPVAVARAFRDTSGGIGERLSRAAGVSEDSLVAEWRAWTLARGRTDRLAASLPQSFAVVFAALLVVFLAARSGRWR